MFDAVRDDNGHSWLVSHDDATDQDICCTISDDGGYNVVWKTWTELRAEHDLYPTEIVPVPEQPIPVDPPQDDGSVTLKLPADVKKLNGPTTEDGTLTFVYLRDEYVVPPPEPTEPGDPIDPSDYYWPKTSADSS